MQKYLVLEDGTIFKGKAFGAKKDTVGELVFNTGMSGYQESITDQSYNGEILMFTYPLIGNYGINKDDYESIIPRCRAVVVHELARQTGNWRYIMSLDDFLNVNNIPGISNIDTRAVTKHIRTKGSMKACLVNKLTSYTLSDLRKTILDQNLVKESSTKNAFPSPNTGFNVAVIDFGLKHSILRELSKRHCNSTIVPYNTTSDKIFRLKPDGVVLTNGPGDPKVISKRILKMILRVEKRIPLFGICFGHQLFALANGADTFKMKFGHRGFNHPVREIATGRIDFTSQNHGYAVKRNSLGQTNLIVTHEEINDGTVEGLHHLNYPAFSVQFHPDASPGPHDAGHLFDEFIGLMEAKK